MERFNMKHIRVLNLDDSVTTQEAFINQHAPAIVDLNAFNTAARFWLTSSTIDKIAPAILTHRNSVLTFLGSSDYHHLTAVRVKQFIHPITVLVLDHYIDRENTYPKVAARGWINETLSQVNVASIIILGVGQADSRKGGVNPKRKQSVREQRVSILPASSMPDAKALAALIPTDDVYVSWDKSCLQADHNLGNWTQGQLLLEDALKLLVDLRALKNIIAIDVCGDYSIPRTRNPFKKLYSKYKHPKQPVTGSQPLAFIRETNQRTNLRIAQVLGSHAPAHRDDNAALNPTATP
jgi:hypothetical protein